jgi:hypothetical protein
MNFNWVLPGGCRATYSGHCLKDAIDPIFHWNQRPINAETYHQFNCLLIEVNGIRIEQDH